MKATLTLMFVAVTLLPEATLGIGCLGQQTPSIAATDEVHIRLQLRQADGEPVDFLEAKDFKVSNGQLDFPVIVTRPPFGRRRVAHAVPTRMLLIDADLSLTNSVLQKIMDELGGAWERGWQVCLLTSGGGLMPCTTDKAQLQDFQIFGQLIEPGPVTFIADQVSFIDVKDIRKRYVAAHSGAGVSFRAHCSGPCHWVTLQEGWDPRAAVLRDGGRNSAKP